MGMFIITEKRDEVFYAKGIGHVDSLWMGEVKQKGETTITPFMIAVHVPRGG